MVLVMGPNHGSLAVIWFDFATFQSVAQRKILSHHFSQQVIRRLVNLKSFFYLRIKMLYTPFIYKHGHIVARIASYYCE